MLKKILSYILSIIILFFIWIFCARIINAQLILPYPSTVFQEILNLVKTSVFWQGLFYTFLRVLSAFFISVILGTVLGILMSVFQFGKHFLELPLAIIRSTPVIAVILLAMFWFNSTYVPVFVAVLMTLPVITSSVSQGFMETNEKLLFMAKTYKLTKKQVYLYIRMPQILPYFLSGCESCFGLCWKVVVAGEVLSLPKFGLGTIMNTAQVHLETSRVLAVTFVLVSFSFILEKIIKKLIRYGK